ncbi:DNA repair protein RecO [Maricaulis sp.]|uniref:DNA repair protein RecO n=1 Tax=Maricaulis sp. TaxID=1486257 RepID=UPI002625E540|nr:DNA repair protein RecO [Maricaulis sp.]
MEWRDKGIILQVRPHGETSAIVEILTEGQGRHAGLVKGARSRAMRPILQPGNKVTASWRARLAEHLGLFRIEADDLGAGAVMEDRAALAGLNAACALAIMALPEREAHPAVHEGFCLLLAAFENPEVWPALYVRWEAGLLSDLGYGLDLRKCAVTGAADDLSHVSPRTGRAVCREEAAPYAARLLELPGFMRGSGEIAERDIAKGLELTGYFLERRVLWPVDKQLPEARVRLIQELERAGLM